MTITVNMISTFSWSTALLNAGITATTAILLALIFYVCRSLKGYNDRYNIVINDIAFGSLKIQKKIQKSIALSDHTEKVSSVIEDELSTIRESIRDLRLWSYSIGRRLFWNQPKILKELVSLESDIQFLFRIAPHSDLVDFMAKVKERISKAGEEVLFLEHLDWFR